MQKRDLRVYIGWLISGHLVTNNNKRFILHDSMQGHIYIDKARARKSAQGAPRAQNGVQIRSQHRRKHTDTVTLVFRQIHMRTRNRYLNLIMNNCKHSKTVGL